MRKKPENEKELVIDVKQLISTLIKFAWLIVIVALVVGALTFVYNSKYVEPKYSSSVMLYVNNTNTLAGGSIQISAADLSAAQSLVDTYIGILNTRTTMEEVAERAHVDYTAAQLRGMVSAKKLDGTEIFTVTVTTGDAEEAKVIANSIAAVLPGRVEDIIAGSSMRVVDDAVVNETKVSPNITKNTLTAAVLAALATALIIAVLSIFDDTIRDEDHLTEYYSHPILSRIPDLGGPSHGKGYGKGYGRGYGYGYGYGHRHHSEKESNDEKRGS